MNFARIGTRLINKNTIAQILPKEYGIVHQKHVQILYISGDGSIHSEFADPKEYEDAIKLYNSICKQIDKKQTNK